MTTKEFITKAFNGTTSSQKCSSVFKDGANNIYSYGYHYPLLFRVGGKAIRNVRGYSSTTGRHIMWSRDVDAIDIHTLGSFRLIGTDQDIMAALLEGQRAYVESCERRIKHHRDMGRRENTQLFAGMVRDLDIANANLQELEA